MAGTRDITATIGEQTVPRDEVLAWEADRAAAVYKKLGMGEPPADVAARREGLAARKLELGHAELERRFRREMAISGRPSRAMTALSRGRRRLCEVELRGPGTAEAMPAFYAAAMASGDEAPLLAASPDHYLLHQDDDSVQQVIETTGGSPLASRIFLGDADSGPVLTAADPAFPVQWVAVGRASLDG